MTSPKKVLLINQYFYPDMAPTSQLLSDLARWVGSNGWEVVVIAGRGSYANVGEVSGSGCGLLWNGVSVRRAWSTNFGRGSLLGRLADYFTFLFSGAITVALAARADVVICPSTPPFIGVLGIIARLKGSRLVYKVDNLYPDVAAALSTLNHRSLATRLLSRLSCFLLKQADWIVTLDDAMTERLRVQTGGTRSVETIPDWADGAAVCPDAQAGVNFRKTQNLDGNLVVLYSGNLGLAQRFDAVMEAAKRCAKELPDVLFLFMGNGARLHEVRKAACGLANVRFMDHQPTERLNELYNAADVHLVTLRDEVSGLLFPSEYLTALAAGKPVLLVGGKGAPFKREIDCKGLGWTSPHEALAVKSALEDALKNVEKRRAMGRSSRQVFEARYSKTLAMQRWEQVLDSVLNGETIAAAISKKSREAAATIKKKTVSVRGL